MFFSNTVINLVKVSLFGTLFLVSANVSAKRNKSNQFLDQKALLLAGERTNLKEFSKTIAFVQEENWDSVLVNTQKLLQRTENQKLLNFIHYYRAEAFHKKNILKYAMREFNLVGSEFEFYTMVRFNKAGIFLSWEKYNHALNLFKSIDTTDQKGIRTIPIDALFHNIGTCYFHLGDFEKAEKYLLMAIQKILEAKNDSALMVSYMELAAVYYEQYQDEKAIVYFEKAYYLSQKYGSFESKQKTSLNMAVVEENRKRYDKALFYRKEYEDWRDSLNDQNKIYEVAQIEKKLALTHEQQRVKLLQTENKLKQARLNTYLFAALFLLLVIIFGTYFYRQSVLRSRVILRQKQELDLLNATKDQLFSIVSHDLRSSVHALSVSNSKLKDKVQKQEYASLENQLEENSVIATNTYNMLDNLLNWALLQTNGGYFKQEEHRLSMLVDHVAFNFKGVLNQKGITFENTIPKSVKVFVDAESLKIVLRNFMDNSIKFSESGAMISVSVQSENEDEVCFQWKDTGKGMSEETRLKLLSDSPQLTKKDHEKTIGSGLGMNLCRAMLAKNAGKLDIWSRQNEGTVMIVTLKKCADGKN
ncbi:tetratricopeptide repeat-containing sensor histidine kinase [uncultured Fluviicola sp.]|uniref:tetratricopeptide repeat-containing sensor histidine kinase n=1 Tax=uncultured Fluviicola sp. TaxID=463303 RepID=UPI0025FD5888|nr:tetratricopeptide repeat-containing sensor histidine kinase [uncultured Fluviicola sp.]